VEADGAVTRRSGWIRLVMAAKNQTREEGRKVSVLAGAGRVETVEAATKLGVVHSGRAVLRRLTYIRSVSVKLKTVGFNQEPLPSHTFRRLELAPRACASIADRDVPCSGTKAGVASLSRLRLAGRDSGETDLAELLDSLSLSLLAPSVERTMRRSESVWLGADGRRGEELRLSVRLLLSDWLTLIPDCGRAGGVRARPTLATAAAMAGSTWRYFPFCFRRPMLSGCVRVRAP
jgi:hypothetical protein